MGRARLAALALLFAVLAPLRAEAAFHVWYVKEVFSNADGSIQYIELWTDTPGQNLLATHTLTVNDGTAHVFTFPTNLPSGDTMNHHMLLATPGFKNLPGAPTPDYTLPCGPFFDPNASSITVTFDPRPDAITFTGATLPKDGMNSLNDANNGMGTPSLSSATNSPTNLAGDTGPLTLTADQIAGTVEPCDDGLYCNGVETCTAGACVATPSCEDGNPCTDDTCTESSDSCSHVAHVGSCNDNVFCNGADTCSGTTCVHAGDPCGGINCNEGPDTCGDCSGAADCEDGQPCTIDTCNSGVCNQATAADGAECDDDSVFCNGVGSCTAGVCGAIAAPCDPMSETCEESTDSCTPVGAMPDAPGPNNGKDDDGGGCCQANTSPSTFTGPGLVLLLGLAFARRRRRR